MRRRDPSASSKTGHRKECPEISFLHKYLSFTPGPREATVTAHFDISFPAIQTQPKDSNPSQPPQCVVLLAAVFVTSSRRTFPRRAAAWRRESPPCGPAEAARLRVAVATKGLFPEAVAEVGGARPQLQVGVSHLGSSGYLQTLGRGAQALGSGCG